MRAKFHIHWVRERKLPKPQRPEERHEVESLRVGSGAKVDVHLRDRLAAGFALHLRPALNGLSIEPIDLFAGAFLNGAPVTGHEVLEPGGALQIGRTLIQLAIPEPGKYVLTIDEYYLDESVRKMGLDDAKRETATLEHDGPPESSWGKDPILRRAVAASVVVGLLWVAFGGGGGGGHELSPKHKGVAELQESAGCANCHAGGVESHQFDCVRCHAALAPESATHPPASTPAGKKKECRDCHVEHHGPEKLLPAPTFVALEIARRAEPLPAPVPKGTCSECHRDAQLPDVKVAAFKATKDRPRKAVDAKLLFESFPHDQHLRPLNSAPIACSRCHVPDRSKKGFEPVLYATCTAIDCHARWKVRRDDHGRNSKVCTDCHEHRDEKELRTAAPAPADTGFSFAPQDHPVTKEACAECHKTGKVGTGRQIAAKRFEHLHHLPIRPDGVVDLEVARSKCSECHANVERSDRLADLSVVDGAAGRLDVNLAACKQCHAGEAQRVPLAAAAGTPAAAPSPRADLVHRLHTGEELTRRSQHVLESGCFDCHALSSDGVSMPVADARVRDCTKCHANHAHTTCSTCHQDLDHRPTDGSSLGCERAVIHADQGVHVLRGGIEDFDHASPNHQTGPDGKPRDCTLCHVAIDRARRLKDVTRPPLEDPSLPMPTRDVCIRCHVLGRFHR